MCSVWNQSACSDPSRYCISNWGTTHDLINRGERKARAVFSLQNVLKNITLACIAFCILILQLLLLGESSQVQILSFFFYLFMSNFLAHCCIFFNMEWPTPACECMFILPHLNKSCSYLHPHTQRKQARKWVTLILHHRPSVNIDVHFGKCLVSPTV